MGRALQEPRVRKHLTFLAWRHVGGNLEEATLQGAHGGAESRPLPRIEREITGPNVFVRPRAATRHVLRLFRDDPVQFITDAASGPKDIGRAISESALCR